MIQNPKILVASPTYKGMKYCQDKFINSLQQIDYPNFDILIIENSEDNKNFNELKKRKEIKIIRNNSSEKDKMKRLVNSRNEIIQYVLDNNYDYVLMMDSDVIPPKNILKELLKSNKDIVSGLYYNYFVVDGKTKYMPVCWTALTEKEFEEIKKKIQLPSFVRSHLDLRTHLTEEEANSGRLIKVLFPSAGCMLIKKEVLTNEKVRYGLLNTKNWGGVKTTDDIYFITKAREQGFECFCNTNVKCEHLIKEKFRLDKQGTYHHPIYD